MSPQRAEPAQPEVEQNEAHLQRLVESVRDYAIFLLDPDGTVVSWSAGAERMKGYRTEEIIGQHFSRFYPAGDRQRGKPEWELRVAAAEGRVEDEGWRVRKDGSRFWANVVITALYDEHGRLEGFGKVTRDLTERKRAEERFRLLVESVRDYAVLMLDPDGYVMSWNTGAQRIKGYRSEEILGQHFSRFYPVEEVRRGKPAEELKRAAAEGRFEDEGWRVRKDGSRFWANAVISAIYDDEGDLQGFAKVTRDLTERKRAEEALRQRTEQLQEANQELESFSYSVSHDLRAPLRHIIGYAELLQKKAEGQLDDSTLRYVRTIAESARHAGALVDDLLAFSRMGRVEMRRRMVDMERLVEEVRRDLAPDVGQRAVLWKVAPLPSVPGDPAMLRLVIENLLSNALKYTQTRPEACIEIDSVDHGTEVVFSVRDNGVGFDMRYVDKLFGIFQRLHAAQEFEGTGIGLANVRRIIHRHGGRTWAEGIVDGGATFFFSLPRLRGQEGSDGADPADSAGGGQPQ